MRKYVIYEIVNTINDKRYIGCSKNLKKRWNEHLRDLRNDKHHNQHLQRVWNKYGENIFEFKVVEELSSEIEMYEREKFLIESTEGIYNTYEGGLGGDRFTNNPNKEEIRKRYSEAHTKRLQDPNERAKCNAFRNLTNEQREERLKVWSEAAKGSKNGRYKYDKKVKQIDKDSGEVINIWNDACEAGENGFNRKYIINCAKGVNGYNSHKGYKWEWVD